MLGISPGHKFGLVSGIGKMCGYCGAILALYLVRPVVAKYGYQATFLPTGLLFFFFSLPCLLFVQDARGEKKKIKASTLFQAKKVFEMVGLLGRIIREGSILSNFLKCSFFGLASVNAVILFMSVYAMRAFGFDKISVIGLITFSTFFAIAGSLLSGLLSDYLGYKRMLAAVFIAWILSFLSGALADNGRSYWIIGALVGATLGSTWVVSRALAMHIAPRDKIGQALGLFNLVGYLSAITGGIFYSLVLWFLKPLGEIGYRISLLSLSVFSVLGFIFLLRIPQVDKNGLKRADHS
jgi:MFS-type transporter involved in bile tolerance (Atg22 family)